MYTIGNKLNKRDKLGIHSQIEKIAIETLSDIIEASFTLRSGQKNILNKIRVSLEVLKNLVRIEYENKIIAEKTYIYIESLLIKTSKITNGWIKAISTQNPPKY